MKWTFFDVVSDYLYIDLNEKYRLNLLNKSLVKTDTQKNLSDLLGVKRATISNWKRGKVSLTLSNIKFLDRYSNVMSFNINNLKKIKSRNGKTKVKGIRETIKFDNHLARFLGHLCGDGSINKNYIVSYTNKDLNLIHDFIYVSRKTFGNIHMRITKCSDGTTNVDLPNIIGRFLSKVFDQIKDKHPPMFLLERSNSYTKEFLGAIFDDEGHIATKHRNLEIGLANKYLLECVRELFLKIGIQPSEIVFKNNKGRPFWRFCVHRRRNMIKFRDLIKLSHKKKNNSLILAIDSYKKNYANYELVDAILNKLKLVPKTSTELAKDLGVLRSSACKTLSKLEKNNLVKVVGKRFMLKSNKNPYHIRVWSLP